MKNRLLPICILVIYGALLIKVMVFKDIPIIRIGSLMLNFGGTNAGSHANFIPFKTIIPYLLGYKGWIIAGINLIGNIALLVPMGFLVTPAYRKMTWKKSLALGVAAGLIIEVLQTVLRVGIFDIDDVILNALGVMIGYWVFQILAKWIRSKNYKNIIITVIICIITLVGIFYVLYPKRQQSVTSEIGTVSQTDDLCGGTGGTGEIIALETNGVTIKRNDEEKTVVTLAKDGTVRTSAGSASASDLKIGDRITLVGDSNPDGSFTANTILVCNASGVEIE